MKSQSVQTIAEWSGSLLYYKTLGLVAASHVTIFSQLEYIISE